MREGRQDWAEACSQVATDQASTCLQARTNSPPILTNGTRCSHARTTHPPTGFSQAAKMGSASVEALLPAAPRRGGPRSSAEGQELHTDEEEEPRRAACPPGRAPPKLPARGPPGGAAPELGRLSFFMRLFTVGDCLACPPGRATPRTPVVLPGGAAPRARLPVLLREPSGCVPVELPGGAAPRAGLPALLREHSGCAWLVCPPGRASPRRLQNGPRRGSGQSG